MNEVFLRRKLIKLALKGQGKVSPNPLVGALVVNKGAVVGQGFHACFGGPHAEVMALREAGSKAENASLYVSLEPCSHFGKTPPCADLIIKSGIKSVWVGMTDPNPLVRGAGISRLESAGIAVEVAEHPDFYSLNKAFIKYISQRTPWVLLKNALTLDGRINNRPEYLSAEKSLKMVHRFRDQYDAVAVGVNTVISDNPALNVRFVKPRGLSPLRVIFDRLGLTPLNSRIFDEPGGQVIIITTSLADRLKREELRKRGALAMSAPLKNGKIDLRAALKKLAAEKQVTSILLEGGPNLNAAFLRERLADEIAFFYTPNIWGTEKGNPVVGLLEESLARVLNLKSRQLGPDILVTGEIRYR